MSYGNPPNYSNTPTEELETLLCRPDLPPAYQQAIGAELNRRYTKEWLSPSASPTSLPQPSQQQEHSPPASTPSAPMPLPQPVTHSDLSTEPTKSGAATLAGWLVGIVVAVVIFVLFAAYDDTQSPTPTMGTVCIITGGACPLSAEAPVGSPCSCSDGVYQYTGFVVH